MTHREAADGICFSPGRSCEDEEQEEDQDAAASLLSRGQDAALIAAIRESDKARAGSAAIRPKQKPGEAHLHH